MSEERNGQTQNDEPPPATPDVLEKGADAEGQEPPSATQDIMQLGEEPPEAEQDIMYKMMTRADLEESIRRLEKKRIVARNKLEYIKWIIILVVYGRLV